MTYRELQTALKNLRNAGYDVQVKLNASFDTLQTEYNRLSAITSLSCTNTVEPNLETTFGEVQAVSEQIEVEFETKHRVELAIQGNLPQNDPCSDRQHSQSTVEQGFHSIPVESETKYRVEVVYLHKLSKNKTFSDLQNSENFLQQGFQLIRSTLDHNIDKTGFESPESLQSSTLEIAPDDSPNSPYWIDGSQLGQNLESTQVQALRNLEDGINWLKKLPARLKAFEQGFREGLRDVPIRQQASLKQPHVIPIERSYRPPKPLIIPLAA